MTEKQHTKTADIGPWTFEPASNELRHLDGVSVKLEDKISLLLATLISRRGEIVSKEDLITHVWDGRELSEQTIPVAISKLRKALGDDVNNPTMLETIPRQGYRLLSDVTEEKAPATSHAQWSMVAAAIVAAIVVWFSTTPAEVGREQIQLLNAEKPGVIVTINDVRTTEATEDQTHLAIAVSELSAYYLSQVSDLLVIRHWWNLDAPDPTGGIFTRYGPATPVYSLKGTLLNEEGQHMVTFVLTNPRNDEVIWSGLHNVDDGSARLFPLFETMFEELAVNGVANASTAPEESVAFWRARYFLELANEGAAKVAAEDILALLADADATDAAKSTARALASRWQTLPVIADILPEFEQLSEPEGRENKSNSSDHLMLVDRASVALFEQKNPQAALVLLEQALNKAPGDHYALSLRGEAQAQLGNVAEALSDFQLAYRLAPYARSHGERLAELKQLTKNLEHQSVN